MTRPRILLTTATQFRNSSLRREDSLTGRNYSQAVALAGGLPLMVATLEPDLAEVALDGVDGVLFTGGVDIDPGLFGREPEPGLGRVDRARDLFELELYRAARGRNLPVLGVCRGIQLINVAHGGTLQQHLPARAGTLQHDQSDIGGAPSHTVELAGDSLLADRLGRTQLRTNSYHHQAADELAGDLRAAGHTADGVIEAIEGSGGGFLLGVQWHPEMGFREHPEQLLPFELLIDAARSGAAVTAR